MVSTVMRNNAPTKWVVWAMSSGLFTAGLPDSRRSIQQQHQDEVIVCLGPYERVVPY